MLFRLVSLFLFLFLVSCSPPIEERELFGTDPGIDGVVFNFAGQPGYDRNGHQDTFPGSESCLTPPCPSYFDDPEAIAIAGNRLYISDTGNSVIRMIDIDTKEVSTIAGSGVFSDGPTNGPGSVATFNLPKGIFYHEGRQSLFVVDKGNNIIREIVIDTPVDLYPVSTFVGNFDAASNEPPRDGVGDDVVFASIEGITGDAENLYVSDKNSIRKIIIASRTVVTIAGITQNYKKEIVDTNLTEMVIAAGYWPGSGHTLDVDGVSLLDGVARFFRPTGLVINADSTRLYVSDSSNALIRMIKLDQTPVTVSTLAGQVPYDIETIDPDALGVGLPSGSRPSKAPIDGFGTAAIFAQPSGIVLDGDFLFIVDAGGGGTVRGLDLLQSMRVETIAGGYNGQPGFVEGGIGNKAMFAKPTGLAIADDGNALYLTNSSFHNIAVIR